jgi:hypothetical protein
MLYFLPGKYCSPQNYINKATILLEGRAVLMSNQSFNMKTPLLLFCFSVLGCGLYFVLLFPFRSVFRKVKMPILRWTSVCCCDLFHVIDRTLHDPTG